jgi:hypothetical protein
MVYNGIKSSGEIHPIINTKLVHFNSRSRLTGKQKNIISNMLNGNYQRYKSINKIIEAKQELKCTGIKVTQKQVSKITGLSLKTVQKHFNSQPIDMEMILQEMNKPQEYTPRPNQIKSGVRYSDKCTIIPQEDYIYPDCPQWVLDYYQNRHFSLKRERLI